MIAESGTGVLARRAAEFELPITVWHADGRQLWPAVAEPAARHGGAGPPPAWRQAIVEAGAEPVEEHGVLAGEVAGLEVCRVVDDPYIGTTRLEVGVGVHDREAFAMLHGNEPAPRRWRGSSRSCAAIAGSTPAAPAQPARPRAAAALAPLADPALVGAADLSRCRHRCHDRT